MGKLLSALAHSCLWLVPVSLVICAVLNLEYTALLTMGAVVLSVIPFFIKFEHKKPRPRDIMPIVILSAIAAVGRILFAPFPSFKPVSAIVMVSGSCFGKESGFLTGALSALASNMFFGQGPWTPWQMYAWGLIGYLSGILAEKGLFDKPVFLYGFGFLSSFLFGFIMDSWHIIGFVHPLTWQTALLAYGAGIPFSLSQAVATVVFLLPIYKPWRKKIKRIKIKYGM